ncbi:MAG: hypothetical protein H6R44_59 [Nitrospirae bacterium]|nr:hypothetical protein [Nitrospirota bacterium]
MFNLLFNSKMFGELVYGVRIAIVEVLALILQPSQE